MRCVSRLSASAGFGAGARLCLAARFPQSRLHESEFDGEPIDPRLSQCHHSRQVGCLPRSPTGSGVRSTHLQLGDRVSPGAETAGGLTGSIAKDRFALVKCVGDIRTWDRLRLFGGKVLTGDLYEMQRAGRRISRDQLAMRGLSLVCAANGDCSRH